MFEIAEYPYYAGDDLGLTIVGERCFFRIWSPVAQEAEIIFYHTGTEDDFLDAYPLKRGVSGTWWISFDRGKEGQFYVFRVLINGVWSAEVTDPYAKFTGTNGRRAMVVNQSLISPLGWDEDISPQVCYDPEKIYKTALEASPAAVIYEMHLRDISVHQSSGVENKGKYLGLTERGTVNASGLSTALDHLVELGVTHVQLLPVFDFYSVDESKPGFNQYNWGYDPMNYNTPEGSYSTDPADARVRVIELKKMILALHGAGIRVVIDMAYNHTALREQSNFNQLVPGYFYRHKPGGGFSDATGCGNETASERPMMRKFMMQSMRYWVEYFHVDGFRIDLMGVHDIETINIISKELRSIRPDILLYGEGWAANNTSPLPDEMRALKANTAKLEDVAVFSDDIRDGIKGSVFRHHEKGFVSGRPGLEETIKFGITASCFHPQVKYDKIIYARSAYAGQPYQCITYCECHDNHNLFDKLSISAKGYSEEERVEMQLLSFSIILTSQGIPFLHAGSEFYRSKYGVENSYASGDPINAIDWNLKTKNAVVFNYVRQLIAMRKKHPVFRMPSAELIRGHIDFLEAGGNVVVYILNGAAVADSWEKIVVLLNGSENKKTIALPLGEWKTAILDNRFVEDRQFRLFISVKPFSCSVLYRQQASE